MKPGDIVVHKLYGSGSVREVRRAGAEACVVFHRGFMLLCPTGALIPAGANTGSITPEQRPPTTQIKPGREPRWLNPPPGPGVETPRLIPTARLIRAPRVSADDERSRARQIIEALRFGIVPKTHIDDLTVGLADERASFRAALGMAARQGGDARAVVGDYGAGKSHFFEWASAEALSQNFLVVDASLDLFETPPNDPRRIYVSLLQSLRYPGRTDGGSLGPLFDRIIEDGKEDGKFMDLAREMARTHVTCPLRDALRAYEMTTRRGDWGRAALILDWIAGERVQHAAIREAARRDVAKLRSFTTVADQYCYLLSGIGWLAREAGYQGLVVLVDESEHYSMLNQTQKSRADVFFQGMIYASLRDRQRRIKGCRDVHGALCGLSHGGHQSYPFSYAENCGLLFMFAATTSDIALDYASWLAPEKVLHLDRALSAEDARSLIERIFGFHRQAYGHQVRNDFPHVFSGAINAYRKGEMNLRELIRLSTEAFDLMDAFTDCTPDHLLKEMNRVFPRRAA